MLDLVFTGRVACVAGGLFGVFFFYSFVVRSVRETAAQMLYLGRNRNQWGRRRGKKASPFEPPAPCPIVFCFDFRAAVQLYLLLCEHKRNKKKTPKKASATQAKGAGEGQLKGVRIRARVRGTLYVKFCHIYTTGNLQSKPGSDLQSRKGESLVGHV